MRIENSLTDNVVLAEMGKRLARTRLSRNISQADLASEAGVAKTTVERLERGGGIQLESLIRILRALGDLDRLDVVISEPLPSPIELLENRGRQRLRAREGREPKPRDSWTWGDQEEGL
jgi:transcriptional regulator with XRE-family HTH domain